MTTNAVLLTDAQTADVRRHLGYPNYASDDDTSAPYYRLAALEALNYRLDHLRPEEAVFVTAQLKAINTAYANYIAAQANLNVLSVSVITNNPNEMSMRRGVYVSLCKDMASWIGVSYKGASGSATRRIV
jgi:hypothetical protein